jgi:hypothetical protein
MPEVRAGRPAVRCSLTGAQHVEQADPFEHLADPRRGIRQSEPGLQGPRDVVGADQLPDVCGIDAREAAHVNDDLSFAAAKQRVHPVPQLGRKRRTIRADKTPYGNTPSGRR